MKEINKERTEKLIEILYDKDMKYGKYLFVRAFLLAHTERPYTVKEIVKGLEEIGILMSKNTVRKGVRMIPDRLLEKSYFRHQDSKKFITEYKLSNYKDIQLFV